MKPRFIDDKQTLRPLDVCLNELEDVLQAAECHHEKRIVRLIRTDHRQAIERIDELERELTHERAALRSARISLAKLRRERGDKPPDNPE